MLWPNSSVHVVAVRALDQAFVHTMMKRHFELGLLLQMATVTKLGLRLGQQKLFGLRVMRRMAGDATDVVLRVSRVDSVHVLRPACVATQAAGIDFFRGSVLERVYLGHVAAPRDVIRPGTMAALAALLGWATLFIQCGLPVRGLLPGVVDFLMTGFAGLGAHIFRSVRGRLTGLGSFGGWGALTSLLAGLAGSERNEDENQQDGEQENARDPGICWHELAPSIFEACHVL